MNAFFSIYFKGKINIELFYCVCISAMKLLNMEENIQNKLPNFIKKFLKNASKKNKKEKKKSALIFVVKKKLIRLNESNPLLRQSYLCTLNKLKFTYDGNVFPIGGLSD
ncbi:hypothetical protein BpHYR1_019144 [Brachionus plicatilis]|uniref:Uncharacterized protein n=1 Tax=Brachionus plicatilis TaxID=10195 RepID=A0A3M7PSN0_BRAPC|nr:hypothetical protein BpHYR1_019144 [Brachionus plicatilis]